jgi:radical SAM superfamily enzyme YgiQ (UPF0313 family)
MRLRQESGNFPVLFLSPPGGFPGIANLGLEIVVDDVKTGTKAPCDVLRSDLFLCRRLPPALLDKIASLDAMDFFYVEAVFSGFSSSNQRDRRNKYLRLNGITEPDKKSLRAALNRMEKHFTQILRKLRPRILAVSLNSDRLITALYFIRIAARIIPGIRTIIGGSALQGSIGESVFASFPEIDHLVYGRGENVVRDLITRLAKGEGIDSVQGDILSRRESGVFRHPRSAVRPMPYPLPEMNSFYEELVRLTEQHGRDAFGTMYGIAVIQSAGCWWNRCDFCSEPFYHNGYLLQDCDTVARYISGIAAQHHISDIFFLDSIQPPAPYIRNLFRRLARHRIPYRLAGEVHAKVDNATLDLLIESGFKTLQIGIESYSQNLLDRMKKGIELIDLFRIFAKCAEKGIAVQGNVLMHHPLETPKDVRLTRRMIERTSHLFIPFLQYYFVAHGSPLESELGSRGTRTYPLMRHALLYPRQFRRRLVFSYRYLPENKQTRSLWRNLRTASAKIRERTPVLVYVDGGETMQIIDTRGVKRRSYCLNKTERDLIVTCLGSRTLPEIVSRLRGMDPERMSGSLNGLVERGIIFRQGERFLTLALPWRNPRRLPS